ncbi:MAG TPA: protein phosphatase 2C domain-containing protein, partial [Acidobacteriaceae bacterium]
GYSVEDGVYLVCDGMGGAAAGEVASSLAIEEVLRIVTARREEENLSASALAEASVRSANQLIHERSHRNPRLRGMGTTLVGVLTGDHEACIFHVGDSRCYRLRAGQIERCTQDHSLVEEEMRAGRMTAAEAARSPMRNVITRALGTQSGVEPEIATLGIEPGDLFLLCSDGLSRELSDQRMESLLSDGLAADTPLDALCAGLIQAANKAGGNDNITCILLRAASL